MNDRMFSINKGMKLLAYGILGLYTMVVAYPILFMFFTSFKSNKEFFVNLFGLPKQIQIMNYANAWSVGKLGTYFFNSAFVTVSSVVITTVLSLLGELTDVRNFRHSSISCSPW